MSEKVENALAFKKEGANCAQAVACIFCEEYAISREDMIRLCAPLGGGFCSGEICGAMAGAMLIVGLKYGEGTAHDKEKKALIKQKSSALMRRFQEEFGKVRCLDILGVNVNTPEGLKAAKPLMDTTCIHLITRSVEILEENTI